MLVPTRWCIQIYNHRFSSTGRVKTTKSAHRESKYHIEKSESSYTKFEMNVYSYLYISFGARMYINIFPHMKFWISRSSQKLVDSFMNSYLKIQLFGKLWGTAFSYEKTRHARGNQKTRQARWNRQKHDKRKVSFHVYKHCFHRQAHANRQIHPTGPHCLALVNKSSFYYPEFGLNVNTSLFDIWHIT